MQHAPSKANNLHTEALREMGTKTTKTACAKRVAANKLVARTETDCPSCQRQIDADNAQEARMAR